MEKAGNHIQHKLLDCLIGYPLVPEKREGIESDVGQFGLELRVDDELLEYLGEAVADLGEFFVVLGLGLFHANLAA